MNYEVLLRDSAQGAARRFNSTTTPEFETRFWRYVNN